MTNPTIQVAADLLALAYHIDDSGQIVADNDHSASYYQSTLLDSGWRVESVSDNIVTFGDKSVTFINPSTESVFVAGVGTDLSALGSGFVDLAQDVDIGSNGPFIQNRIADASSNLSTILSATTTSGSALYGYTVAAGGDSLDGYVYASLGTQAQFSSIPFLVTSAPNSTSNPLVTGGNVLDITELQDFVGHDGNALTYVVNLDFGDSALITESRLSWSAPLE